jgi:nicotinate phosphoribosyltransferase
MVTAAKGKPIVEFGSRRAHGPQAGLLAARASYVAGCTGTSNLLAGQKLGIPLFGTMAHSFIMSFEREEEAFKEFIKLFPSGYLLVDTYDSVAAIKKIINSNIDVQGIRLDSGDPYSSSFQARNILDRASKGSYASTKIMISGDLNEYVIRDLVNRGSPIDSFGVGTELCTSRDDPAMNGVYKLVAIKVPVICEGNDMNVVREERVIYKQKTSPGKKSYPGPKQIYRIIDHGLLKKDIVTLADEEISLHNSMPLLQKMVDDGRLVSNLPSIQEIKNFHLTQRKTLPSKYLELDFRPMSFPVCFSGMLEATARDFASH